jgi:hypothetical protein
MVFPTDLISTYRPFWPPVTYRPPKPPQNKKKAGKLKNIIFEKHQLFTGRLSGRKITPKFIDGQGRR